MTYPTEKAPHQVRQCEVADVVLGLGRRGGISAAECKHDWAPTITDENRAYCWCCGSFARIVRWITAVVAVLALSSCAPAYAMAKRRTPPVACYAIDVTLMSVGAMVGMDAQFRNPQDQQRMIVGYSVAAAFWLPYWFGVAP